MTSVRLRRMSALPTQPGSGALAGLRLSADGFLALGETDGRYELLDGVVVMSPSPSFPHQRVIVEVLFQLEVWRRSGALIRVVTECDVRFSPTLVYRPDVIAFRAERLPAGVRAIDVVPDLVVEVVSPASRAMDLLTKRDDYERFGVREYWAVDPDHGALRAWGLQGAKLVERAVAPGAGRLASACFEGFELDLAAVRASCAG